MRKIETTKLSNGLLIATDFVQDFNSAVAMLVCRTGSRNEDETNNGVSHFLEHMAFKGTQKRTALQIAEEIEALGGEMNAYTSKESTAYYIKLLKDDISVAIDVIADIIQNSTLPAEEIEKERGAILQEMAMYLDDSSDVNSDNFHKIAYSGSTLGMNIIGPKENIEQMKREQFTDYLNKQYHQENMIFGFCGNIPHDQIVAMCAEKFNLPARPNLSTKANNASYIGGTIIKHKKDLEQTQFLLGFKGFSYDKSEEDDYYAAQIMADILGGGMSSRLFQEVREKRGLVYTVSSSNDSYSDTGMFVIHAGVDAKNINELCKVVKEEIHKITLGVTDKELEKTVKQYKAGLLMAVESTKYRASKVANNFLIHGKYITPEETLDKVMKIDNEKVMAIMKKILATAKESKPTVAIYGNVEGKIDEKLLNDWI